MFQKKSEFLQKILALFITIISCKNDDFRKIVLMNVSSVSKILCLIEKSQKSAKLYIYPSTTEEDFLSESLSTLKASVSNENCRILIPSRINETKEKAVAVCLSP